MTTVSYKSGVIEVADNVYAFIQENCATNAGFIVSEEGVMVIDSQRLRRRALGRRHR